MKLNFITQFWESTEKVSLLLTVITVLSVIFSASAAGLKIRLDSLKKKSDSEKAVERARFDFELKQKSIELEKKTKEVAEKTEANEKLAIELDKRTRVPPIKERIIGFISDIDAEALKVLKNQKEKTLLIKMVLDSKKDLELKQLLGDPRSLQYIRVFEQKELPEGESPSIGFSEFGQIRTLYLGVNKDLVE